jgi:sec-independent protein translocase protein TatA
MELIVVLVIALIILGPKRLPAAGRSLGRGLREFKDGVSGPDAPTDQIEPPAPTATIARNTTSLPTTGETMARHNVPVP